MTQSIRNVVCTMYEKHYEYGVGALLNSLVSVGFAGKIIVLYGDKMPFWLSQLTPRTDRHYMLSNTIEVEFRLVESDIHLTYYKPYLLVELMDEYPQSNIFYFDPDITVIGDWTFFEDWVRCGVALCLDQSYPIMPENHPFKNTWQAIFSSLKLKAVQPNNFYVNAGFIGLQPDHRPLINCWQELTTYLKRNGHSLSGIMVPTRQVYHKYNRLNAFCSDQDVLNATLAYSKVPLSIIGPEAMGFIPAGYIMNHNTGTKTWRKNFIVDFLKRGAKFSPTDQSYFTNSYAPIKLYSTNTKRLLKINVTLTKILQRIF